MSKTIFYERGSETWTCHPTIIDIPKIVTFKSFSLILPTVFKIYVTKLYPNITVQFQKLNFSPPQKSLGAADTVDSRYTKKQILLTSKI